MLAPMALPARRLLTPAIFACRWGEHSSIRSWIGIAWFGDAFRYQDYLACFRTRQPSGCAAYSIFIYEVE
jgi:hypothetical protein